MAQERGNGFGGPPDRVGAEPGAKITLPDDILRSLRESHLCSRLTDDEFRRLCDLLRVREVREGKILVAVGSTDTNLYILRKGRVLIRSPEKDGYDPVIRFAHPGEILNELPFITGRPSEVTIETASDVQLWYIVRGEFQQLVGQLPQLAEHLTYTPEEQRIIQQSKRFESQRPGELVLWFSRKHWWVLVRSQWLTFLLLLLIGATFLPPMRPIFGGTFGAFFVAALSLVALLNFLWTAIDYFNDYYAVTDQRVIHRERILLIYDAQDEAPVSMIQSVTVNRPNFLSTLLDAGTVAIETAGARANVVFEWVGQPDAVAKIILAQQARAKVEIRATERSKVRAELREEMRVGYIPPPGMKEEDVAKKPAPLRQRLATGLIEARNNLLPRMRLVRGKDLVYRKHWLALLAAIAAPTLVFLLYTAALVFIRFNVPGVSQLLFGTPFVIVALLIGFVLLFWIVWGYEDWRNDVYIVTNERLIEYRRTPFGLLGTTQRTASLANVQNVTATTRGFIDNLFNIGDVAIRTAGTDNELTFARVWNPRNVQREVVNRVEQFQSNQREREAARRRREFIEWIGIYDELTRIHWERPLR